MTTITEAIKICKEAGYDVNVKRESPLKTGEKFWWFERSGNVVRLFYDEDDEVIVSLIDFGNYFRTRAEAEQARDKVKELLLELKQK